MDQSTGNIEKKRQFVPEERRREANWRKMFELALKHSGYLSDEHDGKSVAF